MYWVHLNSNGFVFKKEESSKKPSTTGEEVVMVTKEEYERIIVGYRRVGEEWIEATELSDCCDDPVKLRIIELKEMLRDTDWVVVEILEAQLKNRNPDHNFDEIYDKRQAWREEIAKLVIALDQE